MRFVKRFEGTDRRDAVTTDPGVEAEAEALRAVCGSEAPAVAGRRADQALEHGNVDQALFWLNVRSRIEGVPPRPSVRLS